MKTNKTKPGKLVLDRETLVPLQADALDRVGGAFGAATTTAMTPGSRVSCMPCAQMQMQPMGAMGGMGDWDF